MKNTIKKILKFPLKYFYKKLYFIENNEVDIKSIGINIDNSIINDIKNISTPANIIDSEIGNYTYISRNSFINLTKIGKFCSIGPNFFCGWGIHPTNGLSTSPIFYSSKKQCGISYCDKDKIEERKLINIGNDVFIGMNVTILDGVTIGDGAIIGAGAVVSKDIPPYAVAVGVPIKIKSYRYEQNIINDLIKIKWWDFKPENLKDVEKYFYDVNLFIEKYESELR